jgi:hypothetical protein
MSYGFHALPCLLVKVLLLMIIQRVTRGRALVANVTCEHGNHVIGLNMPRHVVAPELKT